MTESPLPQEGLDPSALAALRAAADQACALMKVLSNPDRLLIVCQLVAGPQCVGALERSLGIVQPTLSQQLTVLRAQGLVATQRRGKYIEYRLADPRVRAVLETLHAQFCGEGHGAS